DKSSKSLEVDFDIQKKKVLLILKKIIEQSSSEEVQQRVDNELESTVVVLFKKL
ncbi:unnamed protein product, partial [Ceratitis capitata]